jgi:hypothetical protein
MKINATSRVIDIDGWGGGIGSGVGGWMKTSDALELGIVESFCFSRSVSLAGEYGPLTLEVGEDLMSEKLSRAKALSWASWAMEGMSIHDGDHCIELLSSR